MRLMATDRGVSPDRDGRRDGLRGRGETILVVDDNALMREVTRETLDALGYRVDEVGSGEEALEYLCNQQVDLLVLDMIMTGIDGAETYRRALRVRPGQRAIILSGLGVCDRVVEALEMGAADFVSKPATSTALAHAVRAALGRDC